MKSNLKKLVAMGKLITVGFMGYYACDSLILKDCVLNETLVDGIDQIKAEMKLFQKQRTITFDDLVHEGNENICYALKVFEKDIEHLTKFLKLCREGKNEIERALFEPLIDYIETLKETIEVLKAYFED